MTESNPQVDVDDDSKIPEAKEFEDDNRQATINMNSPEYRQQVEDNSAESERAFAEAERDGYFNTPALDQHEINNEQRDVENSNVGFNPFSLNQNPADVAEYKKEIKKNQPESTLAFKEANESGYWNSQVTNFDPDYIKSGRSKEFPEGEYTGFNPFRISDLKDNKMVSEYKKEIKKNRSTSTLAFKEANESGYWNSPVISIPFFGSNKPQSWDKKHTAKSIPTLPMWGGSTGFQIPFIGSNKPKNYDKKNPGINPFSIDSGFIFKSNKKGGMGKRKQDPAMVDANPNAGMLPILKFMNTFRYQKNTRDIDILKNKAEAEKIRMSGISSATSRFNLPSFDTGNVVSAFASDKDTKIKAFPSNAEPGTAAFRNLPGSDAYAGRVIFTKKQLAHAERLQKKAVEDAAKAGAKAGATAADDAGIPNWTFGGKNKDGGEPSNSEPSKDKTVRNPIKLSQADLNKYYGGKEPTLGINTTMFKKRIQEVESENREKVREHNLLLREWGTKRKVVNKLYNERDIKFAKEEQEKIDNEIKRQEDWKGFVGNFASKAKKIKETNLRKDPIMPRAGTLDDVKYIPRGRDYELLRTPTQRKSDDIRYNNRMDINIDRDKLNERNRLKEEQLRKDEAATKEKEEGEETKTRRKVLTNTIFEDILGRQGTPREREEATKRKESWYDNASAWDLFRNQKKIKGGAEPWNDKYNEDKEAMLFHRANPDKAAWMKFDAARNKMLVGGVAKIWDDLQQGRKDRGANAERERGFFYGAGRQPSGLPGRPASPTGYYPAAGKPKYRPNPLRGSELLFLGRPFGIPKSTKRLVRGKLKRIKAPTAAQRRKMAKGKKGGFFSGWF